MAAEYSDEFRAEVCLKLQEAGYPHIKGALTRVSNNVGVPARTISRWFNGESNPPPDKNVNVKSLDIIELFRNEIYRALNMPPETVASASYKDRVTAAAIMADKIMLLQNDGVERVEHNHTVSVEQRVNRINTLLDQARSRRTRQLTGNNPH